MKKCLISLFLCCIAGFCCAQDSVKVNEPELVERTNYLSQSLKEKFFVLKSDKKIRQGLCQVFYQGKVLAASGRYANGSKTGVWRYNDHKGILNQAYNYTSKKLVYATRPDTAFIDFDFDIKINEKDTLTYPVKIGGILSGYYFVFNTRIAQFAKDMHDNGPGTYACLNILSVNANGVLTGWQMLATTTNGFKKLYEIALDKISDEDKLFVPATLNGKPVPSKVVAKTLMMMGF